MGQLRPWKTEGECSQISAASFLVPPQRTSADRQRPYGRKLCLVFEEDVLQAAPPFRHLRTQASLASDGQSLCCGR